MVKLSAILALALVVAPVVRAQDIEHVINFNPTIEDIDYFPDPAGNILVLFKRFGSNGVFSEVRFEVRNKKKRVVRTGPIASLSNSSSFFINKRAPGNKALDIVFTKEDGTNQVLLVTKLIKKTARDIGSLDLGGEVDGVYYERNNDYVIERSNGRTVKLTKHKYPKFAEIGTFEATGDSVGVARIDRDYIALIRDSGTNAIDHFTYRTLNSKFQPLGAFGPITAQSIVVKKLGKKTLILEIDPPDGTNKTIRLMNRNLEGAKGIVGVDSPPQQFLFPSQFPAEPVVFPFPFVDDYQNPLTALPVYYQIVSSLSGTNGQVTVIIKRL